MGRNLAGKWKGGYTIGRSTCVAEAHVWDLSWQDDGREGILLAGANVWQEHICQPNLAGKWKLKYITGRTKKL